MLNLIKNIFYTSVQNSDAAETLLLFLLISPPPFVLPMCGGTDYYALSYGHFLQRSKSHLHAHRMHHQFGSDCVAVDSLLTVRDACRGFDSWLSGARFSSIDHVARLYSPLPPRQQEPLGIRLAVFGNSVAS